jgi:hypothetical protein
MDVRLPTVRVKAGDGFVVINESDFDPNVHELFDAPPVDAPPVDALAPRKKAAPKRSVKVDDEKKAEGSEE